MSYAITPRARAYMLEKEAADVAAAAEAKKAAADMAEKVATGLDDIDASSGDAEAKYEQIVNLLNELDPIQETDLMPYQLSGEQKAQSDSVYFAIEAYAAANGTTPAIALFEERWQPHDYLSIIPRGPVPQANAEEAAEALKEKKLKEAEDLTVLARDQTKGLTGESFINLTSQTHQCILTHYLDPIAAFHRTQLHRGGTTEVDGRSVTTKANKFLGDTIAPNSAKHGAKIILVDDSSADSSVAPVNAVTSLGKTNVDGITPAQLAGILPLLRLYKIYRKEGKETGKVEFKFSNKTDSGFLNKAPEQKFGEFVMDAGYAKGRSAGIKSFDWSFVGGDPFTATRDLTATLKIFFQDFRDLTEVRKDSKNLFDPDGKNLDYKYLDLVLQPDCRDSKKEATNVSAPAGSTGQDHDIFNPDCYEIAVEVGYAPSPDLPAGLRNQTDSIYLTMVEHSFDIGQDGTFELTIDYRARLASLLGDKGMNVLEPAGGRLVESDFNGEKKPLTFDIKDIEKKIKTEMKKSKNDKDYDSAQLDALKSVKSHLLHLRNNSLYRNISNTLLKNNLIYLMQVPTDVFARFSNFDIYDRDKNQLVGLDVGNTWGITPADITIAGDDSDASAGKWTRNGFKIDPTDATASAEELEELAKSKTAAPTLKTSMYFTTVGNLIAVALDHVTGDGSFLNINPRGDIEDLINLFKKAQKEEPEEIEPQKGATESEIVAVEAAKEEGGVDTFSPATAPSARPTNVSEKPNTINRETLKRFRIILGAVTYVDPASGSEKTVNLAHLPVSMQMFRQFMIDRVIAQNRSFYSFQEFIKDILTDIIFDSLNRICFGGYSANDSAIRAGISLISGQGTKADTGADWEEPISSNTEEGIYKDRTEATFSAPGFAGDSQSTFKTLNLALANQSSPIFTNIKTNKAKEFNYLMFSAFAPQMLNSRLHGDKAKDGDNGIAHFRYGSTKGLMKSVSFTKTPLEFAAEERYVREGTDNLLNQLAGRYEMQMSLVGNNMFIPGQYVYFDPVALGIGKTYANSETNRSLANLMGLGGYHIITEVGNSISPGKFETSIKALWETGGTTAPTTGKK